jgi:excisionase family DNA binding protein
MKGIVTIFWLFGLMCYTGLAVNDIITVEEAAQFLHKHPDTIRRWIEQRVLKARRLSAGGHGIYAILRNDLLELMISESIKTKEKVRSMPHKVSTAQRALPL